MDELLDYNNKLQDLNLESLLSLLEAEVKEGQYHRFVSKNDNLEAKQQNKIFLIKMQIMNLYRR